MRTAEELVSKLLSEMPYMVNANVVQYLIELADVAQTEAWNEAIEAAAKSATATLKSSEVEPSGKYDYIGVKGKLYFMPFVELESILKLKKL